MVPPIMPDPAVPPGAMKYLHMPHIRPLFGRSWYRAACLVALGAVAPARRGARTAIDILNERFARGEIDQAEYEAKRRLISQL